MTPSMASRGLAGTGMRSPTPGSIHESPRIASPPPALVDMNGDTMGVGYMSSNVGHAGYAGHGRYGSHSSNMTAAGANNGATPSGRRTPDYFGETARYNPPARSFSNPRPPTANSAHGPTGPGSFGSPGAGTGANGRWDATQTFARATSPAAGGRVVTVRSHSRFSSRGESQTRLGNDYDIENRHPLGMNRI